MPRRTQEQLLKEITRADESLRAICAILGPVLEPEWPDYLVAHLPSLSEALEAIAEGRRNASSVLSGTREALSDMGLALMDLERRDPESATQVAQAYAAATGRDVWADTLTPVRRSKAILKRGQIANAEEARLISGLVADGELTGKSLETAERLLLAAQTEVRDQ
ncbi:hypothetical protein [Oceanicola sp. S124]|uniref:hypothetical protein n=1 Tax=Oceanicola sp. S124 TaxID=1042378 RepID=UPI00110FBDC4|nr:hypothetical protein [Oceanicola sp. S124]